MGALFVLLVMSEPSCDGSIWGTLLRLGQWNRLSVVFFSFVRPKIKRSACRKWPLPTHRFSDWLHGFNLFPSVAALRKLMLVWVMKADEPSATIFNYGLHTINYSNILSMPGLHHYHFLKPRVVVSTGTGMIAISLLAGFSLRSSSRMSRSMIGYLYSYMFLGFIRRKGSFQGQGRFWPAGGPI